MQYTLYVFKYIKVYCRIIFDKKLLSSFVMHKFLAEPGVIKAEREH